MIPVLIVVYGLLPPVVFVVGVAIWYVLAARLLFPLAIGAEPFIELR